ncbi:CHASE2 domain-containing protein [Aliarcobacter butzleri]|uniref:Adenylate/guanylate cyclase domain-containing protein n=1 Tax=Aliarcobacter butzleri TaxID=28197 RepID=A0AAP4UXY2_9BACT|nr:adenylate/guanylate cyclase domain-containing protein [Aliarcobacter butzleri]MCG3717854.1 adenylate/guanylate cyclase domain-containing protein [Aliarcobacter butzleri]MDK2061298.1 adenylate/guanylate cyclase domain-containing protein [Aliarcobacter butzleri]MDK2069269.1 adenylate/guanylate cyclase domain-containing protein [Aliarcobacter butzleri]MDN5051700.1 adenylate/guanylate cyclase domain-containing protein [Aliarcobacter butzleri]MDN5074550.1 adenylate/guanylate cyclase domain-conta
MILNKKIKKFSIYFVLSLSLSIFLSAIYIFFPNLPDSLDNRLRDYLFTIRGELPYNQNVVIVDIDETSIKSLGQWPWSRDKLAKILENLTLANVGIVGLDIVFAEEDRTSPHKILQNLKIYKKDVPNYDLEFANIVENSPVILGYQFDLVKKDNTNAKVPQIPAIFIEKDKPQDKSYLIEAYNTILNIPQIQDKAYSSGFFNNIPDDTGIIRSVPLIISYDDTIYPSLALEVIRVINDTQKVVVQYDENGISNIVLDDISIPTDRYGRMLINFRGPERSFKYISAIDIYNNSFDKSEIDGKIVLIGTSAAGLFDLRATPFDSIFPGVEVHANIIDNILMQDFIYKASWLDGANILIIFVLSIIVVMLTTYTTFWANPIIFLSFSISYLFLVYNLLFDYGIVLNILFPIATVLIASIMTTLFDYFYNIKKEEAIKAKFASKVSKNVMDDILKNIDKNEFSAKSKEVTIFFSDIRGFTNISEKLDAKELISFLNRYMQPMSEIIIKYQGTIDKFIGDAIMAYWNAPIDIKNHCDLALKASLEQLEVLEKLNVELQKENLPKIDIGIGLNTGTVIVGEMGSSLRSDYTVIGDTINLGSRVESLCKYYDSKLNISNFTKDKLQEKYIFRFLDLVKVKGKNEPVEIWQVLGKGEAKESLKEELDLYHKAIEFYKNSDFINALEIFESLENNENKTNKNIYKIYITRCKEFIKTPPKNFDGVYEHTTKA